MPEAAQIEYIIRSESEAYEWLRSALDDPAVATKLGQAHLRFEDWPGLQLRLTGDRFDQTISPTVMKGFLELQRGLRRAYAISRYGDPTKKLTKEERDGLEFDVKVGPGSSTFEIDVQALLESFFETVGGRMEPDQIFYLMMTVAVLFFGKSAYATYLDDRKSSRELEAKSKEQKQLIEHLKFSSEQETERARIISELVRRYPQIDNIDRTAFDARTALIKASAQADQVEVQGLSIDGQAALELTKNARSRSEDVRFDGQFRILKVDTSRADRFRVTVRAISDDLQIDADVQDSTLTPGAKTILQRGEWDRKPVALKINAKELNSTIHQAIIISVDPE